MKAKRVSFSAQKEATLEEFDFGDADIGPNDVILKTRYSLISAGTELASFTGLQPTNYPVHPGYTAVGVVLKKGAEVKDFEVGDRIFTYSGHASVSKARTLRLKPPEELKDEQVPFVRMATVAMTSLRVSSVELGDTVAVIGLGLVGNMASQLFTLAGANTIGIDICEGRLKKAAACNIKHLVNPSKTDLQQRIKELTDGRGCEVTVEAIGNPKLVETACQITKHTGEVILLGSPRGEYQANVTNILNYVHLNHLGCLTFKGAHEWRYPVNPQEGAKHSLARNSQIAFRLIAENRLNVREVLTHVVKPEEVAPAYNGLLNEKEKYLGVLIDWGE